MNSFAIIKIGLLAVAGFGAEVRVTDRIIALVQDSGRYTTTITIVNLESTVSSFEIFFCRIPEPFGRCRCRLLPMAPTCMESSPPAEA